MPSTICSRSHADGRLLHGYGGSATYTGTEAEAGRTTNDCKVPETVSCEWSYHRPLPLETCLRLDQQGHPG